MYPKRSGQGDGSVPGPVRTSDRLRRRPKLYNRTFVYYTPTIIRPRKSKSKSRANASRIAKILCPSNRSTRNPSNNSAATKLRRSTRKRRIPVNLEGFTDSSGSEDEDLMKPTYRTLRNRIDNNVSQDELSSSKHKKIVETKSKPRREGLRPRRSKVVGREQLNLQPDDEQDTSDDKIIQDETENGNDIDDNDADDGQNDDEAEDEGDGEGEYEGEEDGDDEEGEDEEVIEQGR